MSFPRASEAISGISNAFKNSTGLMAKAANTAKAAISGLWTVIAAHPIVAATTAIIGLVVAFKSYESAAEKATKKMDESFSAYESAKQKVADVNTELEQTKQSIDELEAKDGLTFVEQAELDKLREANELLEIQKRIAEKEELEAKKNLARDTVDAFHENFSVPVNEERTQEKYNSRKGSQDPGVLISNNEADISSIIAGIKLLGELRDQMEEEGKDWQRYNDAIDSATNMVLVDQMKTLTGYKENLEAIPYDELTKDQQEALKEINGIIEYAYKELDPATWNQMQFDKIFDDRTLADAKQKLVDFAKETNTAIKEEDILGELRKAIEGTDFSIDDLVANINAEAGIINIDEATKKIKSDFKENLEERISDNIDVHTGVAIDPELDIDDTEKEKLVSEFDSWFDDLSDEDKLIVWKAKCELDITDWDLDDFKSYLESEQQKAVESVELPPFSSIFESDDNDSLSKQVKEFQSNISTIDDTIESLRKGEDIDWAGIESEFPAMIGHTKDAKDALESLNKVRLDELSATITTYLSSASDYITTDLDSVLNYLSSILSASNLKGLDLGSIKNQVISAMIPSGKDAIERRMIADQINSFFASFEDSLAKKYSAKSLISDNDAFSDQVSSFKSDLSAVQEAIDDLTYGTDIEDMDFSELSKQFPDLIGHTNDAADALKALNDIKFDILSSNLDSIIGWFEGYDESELPLIQDYIKSLLESMDLSGLDDTSLDRLFQSISSQLFGGMKDASSHINLSDMISDWSKELSEEMKGSKVFSFEDFLSDEKNTKAIDDFQSKLSTIQTALDDLDAGEEIDLVDLSQELGIPELVSQADKADQILKDERIKLLTDFASIYQEITKELRGEDEQMKNDFFSSILSGEKWSNEDVSAIKTFVKTADDMLNEDLTDAEIAVIQEYKDAIEERNARIDNFIGNVDINHRTIKLNDEQSYAKVSETIPFNFSDFGLDQEGAFVVTPVLPNGDEIEDINKYIQEKIDSGENIEDLDIFMGSYKDYETASQEAAKIFNEQEGMYSREAQALRGVLAIAKEHNWEFDPSEYENLWSTFISQMEKSISFPTFDDFLSDKGTTEIVDNFQSNISTINSALDTLRSGEKVDLTDLVQELDAPELISQVDNLGQALSRLKADQFVTFAKKYKEATKDLNGVDLENAKDFLNNLILEMDWSSDDIKALEGLNVTVEDMLTEKLSKDEMAIVEAYQKAIEAKNARVEKLVGNVDVNHRPVRLNEDGSYSTLESETYNFSDFGIDKPGAFNVTPILPNGDTIENLEDYIQEIVDSGGDIEDSNIFLGAYENLDAASKAAETLHEEQEAMYQEEASALESIDALTAEKGLKFITPEKEDEINEFVAMVKEAYASIDLDDLIQSKGFTSTVSDYQSKMENLISIRKKLNKTKGKLDTSDLQEAISLCPELITHLDDIESGVDELSDTANNDMLDYFADQIDRLREAGRDADADALQEYANALVENANTIEQTFIRIGEMKIPAPDVESWKDSLETENPGDLYDDMVSGLKDAKELYDKELIGTDDFKSFAALISPTGSDDAANFLENLEKAKRYLTEDSSGLQNFLADMQELGYATKDVDGNWTWDLGNGIEGIQEAADKAGISVSFLMAMFSKAEDYGAYNDFFTTEEEGAERLDELYGDLAAEKRRLAEIKANPNTENYDTAVAESEAKIAEYEERIRTLNEELDNFTAYTPEQVADRAAEAIEIAQSLQNDINNAMDERAKSYLKSELDDFMRERHLVVDVDGNFTSLEEAASNLDLDINLDASADDINTEIDKVSDHISQMNNGAIEFDQSQMQSALDILSYLIQRKQELEAPAVMNINDDQLANVDTDISNATTAVMNLQKAYNELEFAQAKDKSLGIDANTQKAQENLEAAKQAFDEIDDSVKKELNIDVSMDADDQTILDQIKNMDLSAFDETPKLSYKFEITNEAEYKDVMDKLEALSNSEEPVNITVTVDLSGVDQDQLENIQTALDNYKKSNSTATVKLEGLPNVKRDTQTAANYVNALDNVTGKPTVSVNDQASGVIDSINRELNALALRKPINIDIKTTRTTVNKTVNAGESGTGGASGINNSPITSTHKSSGVAKARGDARFLRKTTKKNETLVGELGRKYFAAAYSDVRRKYYLIAENS